MPPRLKNNLHLFSQKRCQQLQKESSLGTAGPLPPARHHSPGWVQPSGFPGPSCTLLGQCSSDSAGCSENLCQNHSASSTR